VEPAGIEPVTSGCARANRA